MTLSYTPYSHINQAFSDEAHLLAQDAIYPLAFKVARDQLHFIDLPEDQSRERDYNDAIDKHVGVAVCGLHAPLIFPSQERFRKKDHAPHRDATVTEWNHNSDKPGELYKIKADIFVYGYYDDVANTFLEAIVFSVFLLKLKLSRGQLTYDTGLNPRSNQTYFGFKFDDLKKHRIVLFHKEWSTL